MSEPGKPKSMRHPFAVGAQLQAILEVPSLNVAARLQEMAEGPSLNVAARLQEMAEGPSLNVGARLAEMLRQPSVDIASHLDEILQAHFPDAEARLQELLGPMSQTQLFYRNLVILGASVVFFGTFVTLRSELRFAITAPAFDF